MAEDVLRRRGGRAGHGHGGDGSGPSPGTAAAARRPLCVGTPQSPGVLAGNYRSGVVIEGACTVSGGPAVVHGTLTLTPGSALVAAFGLNDLTGKGNSKLTVFGRVDVRSGATLVLGCEPNFFTCVDDPTRRPGGPCRVPAWCGAMWWPTRPSV